MAITNILKGLIGKEDLKMGLETFDRIKSDGSTQELTELGLHTFIDGAHTPDEYGCVMDGVEDDSEAFQDCLDDGGLIFIPPGAIIGLGEAPALFEQTNSHIINAGTIKLLSGAHQNGNPSVDPPGVFAFHHVLDSSFYGGIIDGNNQRGANGVSFSHVESRSGPGGTQRNFLSNVRIRNCIHSTDAEEGSEVPHTGGLGNSGGKAITVQFGSPGTVIQGIFIDDCSIGFSVEGKVNDGGRTRNVMVQNVVMEDCRIGLHLLGSFQPPGLGSDYFGAQFYGIDMRNCGVDETSFGVINCLQASNVRVRGLRITNTSGESIGIRGTQRNCEFEGLIEAATLKHVIDFTRNTDGSHPSLTSVTSRHNVYDLTVKVHGLGVDGDQFTGYRINHEGGSNDPRYNQFIFRWMVGDGTGVYTDNLVDDAYGLVDESTNTFHPTNRVTQWDIGGQSW